MQRLAQRTHLTFSPNWPKLKGGQNLVIYDRKLLKLIPSFAAWLKGVPRAYGVEGGEKLKNLKHFASHMERILELCEEFSPAELCIVTVGGGSVGDFGGFVASIFKRGVRLIHIPSTWLAALDSSHGGKTALNVGSFKNQIGTFYPAEQVILVRSLLFHQPEARTQEAFSELAKMAWIDGGAWARSLAADSLNSHDLLWKYLKPAIRAKYAVVSRDPFEKKGIRSRLNLGHTFGHALESLHKISHGEAVGQGLHFALSWSLERGLLSRSEYARCLQLLEGKLGVQCWLKGNFAPLDPEELRRQFRQDKKRSSREHVGFVFLQRRGRVRLMKVSVDELLAEARRQGWSQ